MNQITLIEELGQFGLTRQEAQIYISLVQKGELTGYEAAKQTGISRSNTYSAMAGLVEKGAAYLVEGNASKYIPVPPDEFCNNRIRSLEHSRDILKLQITTLPEPSEGYITITGMKHISNKIYHMIEHAEKRIYISATTARIEELKPELIKAIERKIKVVIISDATLDFEGSIRYLAENKGKQFHLICDSNQVLTGEVSGMNADTCLFSGQSNFVNVLKEAMRNEIKLLELTQEGEKS